MLEKRFVNNALSFTNKACAALSRSNVLFLKVSNYLGMNQWFMHAWLIDNFKGVAVWLAQIAHSYISAPSWRVKNISGHICQLNFRPKSPIGNQQIEKKRKIKKGDLRKLSIFGRIIEQRPFVLSFSCSSSPFRYSQIRMNHK